MFCIAFLVTIGDVIACMTYVHCVALVGMCVGEHVAWLQPLSYKFSQTPGSITSHSTTA